MCRIILGGSGGQGIVTLSKLLAIAGMNEGRAISCYPIYGAEMRGGYTFATVLISETEISSPIVSEADLGIFLDPFAYEYLGKMMAEKGVFVINADLVKAKAEKRRLFSISADAVARKVGDQKAANMVVAGFLARRVAECPGLIHPFPALKSLKEALPSVLPGKPGAVALSEKALLSGYQTI
ncbi:MAG: 2-oxoacid:acceptor oxidoreductase family protein [Candidatus Omnitrophota bacterium]